MKKLFFILVSTASLMSCADRHKTVILGNGSKVEAFNTTDIEYVNGSTVCIHSTSSDRGQGDWLICKDGEMKDTTYIVNFNFKGTPKMAIVKHRIAKVTEL